MEKFSISLQLSKTDTLQETQNETEPRLHFTGHETLLEHCRKSLAPLPGMEDWKREKKNLADDKMEENYSVHFRYGSKRCSTES